jgi:hypothetical protein
MPMPQEEVTRAWEVVVAAEAAHVTVVRAAEGFAQEPAMARESAMALVWEVEARATLVEREAWERVSRVEVESDVVLASAHGEVEDLARRISLLEGELAKACQAWDITKENSRGLSNMVADVVWQLEESKREC